MNRSISPKEHDRIHRTLGGFSATCIVVANMIGAGIFTTSGILSGMLPGSGWVLAGWVLGGLIALSGALCYAELASRMPEAGAEYAYLRDLYHPSLGFLTGWTSFFVGFSAAIAASAMGFSEYFFAGLQGRLPALAGTETVVLKKGAALVIIAAFTAVHYRGTRVGTRVQNPLTILKVAMVLGLALAGLLLGKGEWSNLAVIDVSGFRWTSVGTAMMLIMFAYSGWNASAYIAEELRNPCRTLAISLAGGTVIVIALYLALNLFIFRSVPFADAAGIIAIVEKASAGAFGQWMGKSLSLMISVALLSSLSAYIIIGPRVYYAMARDRMFLPFAAQIHPRFGVPSRSIAIQGAVAALLVLAGSFEQLLIYLGFALGIFPWLAVAGVFIARRRRVGEVEALKTPGYPVVPVFFLCSMLVLMVFAYVNRPLESTAAVITVLAGVPCYFIWGRSGGSGRDEKGITARSRPRGS